MAFSVKIMKDATALATFASPTPFLEPLHSFDFDDSDPARLVAINRTWVIDGVLRGDDATVTTAWNALVAILEDHTNYPNGIQFLRDAAVVQQISAASGYSLFKVEQLESPRSDTHWVTEARFKLRVTGRRRLAADFSTGGTEASNASALVGLTNITKIEQREAWIYSPTGLLRQTLSGRVEVSSGDAVEVARFLALELPGDSFAYETRGPEGLDVTREDLAGRIATYTCVIQECGVALRPQVAADFSRNVLVDRREGKERTVTTVSASGLGAYAAVIAERPGGPITREVIEQNEATRTARATYEQEGTFESDASVKKTHKFVVTGGGIPVRFTERTGGLLPVPHKLPRTAVKIVETFDVEFVGAPKITSFKFPRRLEAEGLIEDTDAGEQRWPEAKQGVGEGASAWTAGVTRVYWAASLENLLIVIGLGALEPKDDESFEGEVNKKLEGIIK